MKFLKRLLITCKKIKYRNRVDIVKSFKKICKLYGAKLKFDVNLETLAEYDFDTNEVILDMKLLHENKKTIVSVFTHEIAHHLQSLVYTDDEIDKFFESYKENLRFEREAERFAYFVCINHYNNYFHHKEFSCYTSKKDKDLLKSMFI